MLREMGGKRPPWKAAATDPEFAAPVSCGLLYDSGDQRRARRDVRVRASSLRWTPGRGTSSLRNGMKREKSKYEDVRKVGEEQEKRESRRMMGASALTWLGFIARNA